MENSKANSLGRIYPLDLFRVISAFVVLFFHLNIWFGVESRSYKINTLISTGAVFMVGFFMLSGFLLFYQYNEKDLLEKENMKDYYIRRVQTVFPAYIILLLIVYSLKLSFPKTMQQALAAFPIEVLGLQSLFPKLYGILGNGGTWFFSVIVILYFIYPFLQHFIKQLLKYRIFILVICYFFTIYPSFIKAFYGGDFSAYYANPIFRLPEFVIGMIIANIVISKNKKSEVTFIVLILSTIIFVLGISLMYDSIFFNNIKFQTNYTYYNIFVVPMFALITYCLATTKNIFLTVISKNFFVQYLSNISYAFFITQTLALRIVNSCIKEGHLGLTSSSYLKITIYTLFLNIIFSILVHELIEKPIRNYFRKSKIAQHS